MIEIKKLEQLLFKILEDMEEYLPYFVLVGGWVPYLYVKYLWKNLNFFPVTTTDVDFGIPEGVNAPPVAQCLYAKLSKLKYKERHMDMGRMFPIVPIVENPKDKSKLLIEFIATVDIDEDYLESLIGRQIFVNRLEKFDLILKDSIPLSLTKRGTSPPRTFNIKIPPPHIFIFHKALTLTNRITEAKISKDIYYIYFVLRFHPQIESLLKDIKALPFPEEKQEILRSFRKYFSRKTSEGCLMVERENGLDSYIYDIREDAFERFTELMEAIST